MIVATFMLINLCGLQIGMGGGVLVSMVCFIYEYASVPVVQRVRLRSNVIRSLPLSSQLNDLQDQVITLRCRGYVFFGSTLQVYGEVGGALSTLIACADFGSPLIASDAILMQL